MIKEIFDKYYSEYIKNVIIKFLDNKYLNKSIFLIICLSFLFFPLIVYSNSFLLTLSSKRYPNIILIIPDALRAKQLPLYGYGKIVTKSIDMLAKDSVVFNNCYVKTPGTVWSFSNLFSGSWSASDGLINNEKTLAIYLKEHGYHTVGFVSSEILRTPDYHNKEATIGHHFNRGFDEYFQELSPETQPRYYRKNEAATQDIIKWLDNYSSKNTPFFLFAHYMDPHSPYDPSYDGEIEKIDKELSIIVEKLKKLDLYKESIILFTSDHGESLREHNAPDEHGTFIYTEQIKIPLLIKFPKEIYKKTIYQIVRNIDILPTLLDYLKIEYESENMDGKSLMPAIIKGKKLNLLSFNEVPSSRVCPEGSEGLIFNEDGILFQYIQGSYSDQYRELYNLSLDPDEIENLYNNSSYKKKIEKYINILNEIKKQKTLKEKKINLDTRSNHLTQKQLEALKTLGYIAQGLPAPFSTISYFTMRADLYKIGILRYKNIIRNIGWGVDLSGDGYYPYKIITKDNQNYFIIANQNKQLIKYNKKEGFKYQKVDNIDDIAFGNQNNVLYVIQNNEFKILELDGININFRRPLINDQFKFKGVSFDQNDNIYLLNTKKMVKLEKNLKVVDILSIPDLEANQIAIDKNENIFFCVGSEISHLNKYGSLVKSFGKKGIKSKICSIAIDDINRIWTMEANPPSINIYDSNGELITSFIYNNYKGLDSPIPIQLFICHDQIYILDSWEGILEYSLNY